MLVIALWWFSTSKASLTYRDLVGKVSNTFDECLDIAGDVVDYFSDVHALGNVHRRRHDGGHDQLWACVSMLKAMDQYRENHSRLVVGLELVHRKERAFLNQLLKPISQKMDNIPIYIASRDGDLGDDFHKKCDDMGPTVTIVETITGNVFGGYSSVSWGQRSTWHRAPGSFLFQLRPNLNRFFLKNNDDSRATMHLSNHGPRFGRGYDLQVLSGALTKNESSVKGQTYYADGHTLNDGVEFFQARDYVVFRAIGL